MSFRSYINGFLFKTDQRYMGILGILYDLYALLSDSDRFLLNGFKSIIAVEINIQTNWSGVNKKHTINEPHHAKREVIICKKQRYDKTAHLCKNIKEDIQSDQSCCCPFTDNGLCNSCNNLQCPNIHLADKRGPAQTRRL